MYRVFGRFSYFDFTFPQAPGWLRLAVLREGPIGLTPIAFRAVSATYAMRNSLIMYIVCIVYITSIASFALRAALPSIQEDVPYESRFTRIAVASWLKAKDKLPNACPKTAATRFNIELAFLNP
jgi:hypothetical protein